jgi:hypothetical protein
MLLLLAKFHRKVDHLRRDFFCGFVHERERTKMLPCDSTFTLSEKTEARSQEARSRKPASSRLSHNSPTARYGTAGKKMTIEEERWNLQKVCCIPRKPRAITFPT